MSVNGGVVLCLRKGIRFQRYVKYKAKCEANFGGGEKRIRFRGKVEDGEAGVLAAKRRATPTPYGLLGAFPGVHGLRVAGAEGCGEGGDVRGTGKVGAWG